MAWTIPSALRQLGTSGAVANARAELDAARQTDLQLTTLVARVNRSGAAVPLCAAPERRAA